MHAPRKPLWPKIVATMVVLGSLYVVSCGPMAWMLNRGALPDSSAPVIEVAYWPLWCALEQMPAEVQTAHEAYWWWWADAFRD